MWCGVDFILEHPALRYGAVRCGFVEGKSYIRCSRTAHHTDCKKKLQREKPRFPLYEVIKKKAILPAYLPVIIYAYLFCISFMILALFLSPRLRGRNSDLRSHLSHSMLFFPLHTTGRALHSYRGKTSAISSPVDSRRFVFIRVCMR